MNKVMLVGNVTKNPEIRTTKNGKSNARFTVAINKKEGADFIPCVAWERLADIVERFIGKGSRVGVTGHLTSGSYEKDGKKVFTLDVTVEELDLPPREKFEPQPDDGDGEDWFS